MSPIPGPCYILAVEKRQARIGKPAPFRTKALFLGLHENPRRNPKHFGARLCVRVAEEPLNEDLSMQLNHLHLSVSDVPACTNIFARYFGFSPTDASANGGFAVLSSPEGFVLVLMRHAKDVDPEHAYPSQFHIGFLIADEARVAELHAAMNADGLHVSELEFSRGGRRFYLRSPGGVLIEVGHRA